MRAVVSGQRGVHVAKQVEFHFQTAHQLKALASQLTQCTAQTAASIVFHRLAVGIIQVAKNPTGIRGPGQATKCAGVGHHDQVGSAGQLLSTHTRARLPHWHGGTVRGVLQNQRGGHGAAIDQRAADGIANNGFATGQTVLIGKNKAQDFNIVGLNSGNDIFRLGDLVAVPESVPVYKTA